MKPARPRALNAGVAPREAWSWAMLDFANSGYTTVVLTAVFSAYFVGVVAGGAPWAALAWTATLSVSYLLVMFTLPALGARADARARKRSLLFAASLGCIVGTLVLTRVGPGDLWLAIVAVVFSNYCYSVSDSAIASFLPELAAPQALGRVSGWGWAMGYFGGLLSLGVALAIVLVALSNFFFGTGENVIAAFLPELAEGEAIGKISGWGWSLGYLGGLVSLSDRRLRLALARRREKPLAAAA